MAEEPLPDTAPLATRALLAVLGFLLLMFGGEVLIDKEGPRWFLGVPLIVLGTACFYSAWAWKRLRARLTQGGREKAAAIATDPRWWLATLLVFLIVMAASPYVEQRRWPFEWVASLRASFSPSAQEIAAAIAPIIKSEMGEVAKTITRTVANLPTTSPVPASTAPSGAHATDASASTVDPSRVTLTLRLFGSAGPVERESHHTHWSWWVLESSPLPDFSHNWTAYPQPTPYATLIFLSFDHSINYDSLRITSPDGDSIPAWELQHKTDTSTVILFHGTLDHITLVIEPIVVTIAKTEKPAQ